MDVYEAAQAVSIDRRETGSSRAGILKRTREEKAPLTGPLALPSGPPDCFAPQFFRQQLVAPDPVLPSEIAESTDPVFPGSHISALDVESHSTASPGARNPSQQALTTASSSRSSGVCGKCPTSSLQSMPTLRARVQSPTFDVYHPAKEYPFVPCPTCSASTTAVYAPFLVYAAHPTAQDSAPQEDSNY